MAFKDCRYTVVCQRRRTSDALFGFLGDLINLLRGVRGYSVYVFFGECSSSSDFHEIAGPCIEVTTAEFRELRRHLEPLSADLPENQFREKFEQAALEFAVEASKRPGTLSAIELRRDGKLTITVEADRHSDPDEQRMIASQAYFFVRDICHVHQHHAPSTDTILDVTPVERECNAWKRETLYSFYRWVIQQKRARSVPAYLSAKGVLAYARAFEKTHCDPMPADVPEYLHNPTVESIQAGLEQAQFRSQTENVYGNVIINRILPTLAFIVALLTPLYSKPDTTAGIILTQDQQLLTQFAEWFNAHALKVVSVTFAAIVVYNIGVTLRTRLMLSTLAMDTIRLAFRYGFWKSLVTSIVAILALLVVAYHYQEMALSLLQKPDPGP